MNAPATRPDVDRHLRVEVVNPAHRDWPAVRRQIDRGGRDDWLMHVDGRLSARQAVVAAFVQGRAVAHAAFHVEPAWTAVGRSVVARVDSRSVDAPFAGTSVEHLMMTVAHSRARTMGCPGGLLARRSVRLAA